MTLTNAEIASLFDELADLLELDGANSFRVRAYRNAARTIKDRGKSMADLLDAGADLSKLPGIGKDLAEKIETLVDTGRLPLLEEMEQRIPPTALQLLRIPGLGPKRVKRLFDELGITSLDELRQALDDGRVRSLPGFGEKSVANIAAGIDAAAAMATRMKLADAEDIAAPLVEYLERLDGVERITIAGSYRRRKETVGDLDILVIAATGAGVMNHLAAYDGVRTVVSKGETRSTVRLRSGLSLDLRVVPAESYGAALHYFTGSKAHNIAVRRLAIERRLKLNEYGVFDRDRPVAGRTEEEVYAAVDLPFIPPELRESRGEIEAAQAGELPELIELEAVRGDLHCHTKATDGHHSIEQMARAARKLGHGYLGISDHSRHLAVANGLDEKRLHAQCDAIERLNEKLDGIVVLKSVELDILEDGSLDLPDSVLERLDFTIGAVHFAFGLSRRKQTERILRAMDNLHFNILAHPTGRLINEREPYAIDLETVMREAAARGCMLELNANPDRLDLSDTAAQMARDMGLRVSIATDAHNTAQLGFMRYGIDQARRGWLSADDVINTRSRRALLQLLKRR